MKCWYRTLTAFLLISILVTQLSGCAVGEYTTSNAVSKVREYQNTIVPHSTNREAVERILGKPYICSNYFRVDVFRERVRESIIPTYFLVPVGYMWDTKYIYTLVAYDENNIVSDIDIDTYNMFSLAEKEHTLMTLNAANFEFYKEAATGEMLIHSKLSLYPHINQLGQTNHCTVVIGSRPYRNVALSIDGGEKFLIRRDTVAAFTLSAGKHELVVSTLFRNGVLNFSCEDTKIIYLEVNYVSQESSDYIINKYENIPDYFADCRILLWSNGNWIDKHSH